MLLYQITPVLAHRGLRSTNDDAAICAWDQKVINTATLADTGVCQIRRLLEIRGHDSAACSMARHDLLRALVQHAGSVAVGCEYHLLGLDIVTSCAYQAWFTRI